MYRYAWFTQPNHANLLLLCCILVVKTFCISIIPYRDFIVVQELLHALYIFPHHLQRVLLTTHHTHYLHQFIDHRHQHQMVNVYHRFFIIITLNHEDESTLLGRMEFLNQWIQGKMVIIQIETVSLLIIALIKIIMV